MYVPLEGAVVLRPEERAKEAAGRLRDLRYDAAPVHGEEVQGVFTVASAANAGADARVADVMRPFSAHVLVSADACMDELIERLAREPFLFVVEGVEVRGFVTPADLGSVPVQTHFYLQLATLESALGNYLRLRYPDQQVALQLLAPTRRDQQKDIADQEKAKDTFIDELACVSLQDLVALAGKDQAFRDAVAEANVGWHRVTRGLIDFRNTVMHPTRQAGWGASMTPDRLIKVQKQVRALLSAVSVLSPLASVGSGAAISMGS